MSPLQIERSLSVHSGTTGKNLFHFWEKNDAMKGRKAATSFAHCILN